MSFTRKRLEMKGFEFVKTIEYGDGDDQFVTDVYKKGCLGLDLDFSQKNKRNLIGATVYVEATQADIDFEHLIQLDQILNK